MITHEQEIVINRPVADVFAFLTDFANYPRWQEDLVEYRQTSAGPLTIGSTGSEVRNVLGHRQEATWQVTELKPNELYATRGSGAFAYEIRNTFQAEGSATRVRVRFQGQPTGLLRVAEPLMAGAVTKGFSEGYENMKRLLEAHA